MEKIQNCHMCYTFKQSEFYAKCCMKRCRKPYCLDCIVKNFDNVINILIRLLTKNYIKEILGSVTLASRGVYAFTVKPLSRATSGDKTEENKAAERKLSLKQKNKTNQRNNIR
jgi:hypothetical protein